MVATSAESTPLVPAPSPGVGAGRIKGIFGIVFGIVVLLTMIIIGAVLMQKSPTNPDGSAKKPSPKMEGAGAMIVGGVFGLISVGVGIAALRSHAVARAMNPVGLYTA